MEHRQGVVRQLPIGDCFEVDEASIPQTPVDYAGENGISTTRISGFMECASGPDSTRFRL